MKILFFDSGVGGLSVFKDVLKRLPEASYYYLFDHECFPYGNKSEVFLQKRVCELLTKLSAKVKPDLIVIACNTASTIVLPTLREHFMMPIVGVVPAIKPAAKLSRKKIIALLATQGTVKRAYTDFLINEFAPCCKVIKIGSQDLVRLCEGYLIQESQQQSTNEALELQTLESLKSILSPISLLPDESKPDVVVLGCTHFPLLKQEIATILGPEIKLVDSGEAVARRVQSLLEGATFSKDCEQHEQDALGPQEAFYTGKCSEEEHKKLQAVFTHFGFKQLCHFSALLKTL